MENLGSWNSSCTERFETCCDAPSFDVVEGRRVCSNCGIVNIDVLYFEDCAELYVTAVSQHAELINRCMDDASPLDTDGTHISSTFPDGSVSKWHQKLNAMITYTNPQRVAFRLRCLADHVIDTLDLSCGTRSGVHKLINAWIESRENLKTMGANRLGILAFMIYSSGKYNDEKVAVDHVCIAFNIPKTAFFKARKRMHEWITARQTSMEWVLKRVT
jgi:hypothetical protein